MSAPAYRGGGQPFEGLEAFFIDQLPYFLGELIGLGLMVFLPWLILRRWAWGRWVAITVWAVLAFALVSAVSDPYFPRDDVSTWWSGPVGLLTVLILARYDRPWAKSERSEDGERPPPSTSMETEAQERET